MIQLLSAPSGKSILAVNGLCEATGVPCTLALNVTLIQGPRLQWQDLRLVDLKFFARNSWVCF